MRRRLDAHRLGELGEAFLASWSRHLGSESDDITKDELRQQARNAGVQVPSTATKDEVKDTLSANAER